MWWHLVIVVATCAGATCSIHLTSAVSSLVLDEFVCCLLMAVACVDLVPHAASELGADVAALVVTQVAVAYATVHFVAHRAQTNAPADTRVLSSGEHGETTVCHPCEPEPVHCTRCSPFPSPPPSPPQPLRISTFSSHRINFVRASQVALPVILHIACDGVTIGLLQRTSSVLHVGLGVMLCVSQDAVSLAALLTKHGIVNARWSAWWMSNVSFSVSVLVTAALCKLVIVEGDSNIEFSIATLSGVAAGMLLPTAFEMHHTPTSPHLAARKASVSTLAIWYVWTLSKIV